MSGVAKIYSSNSEELKRICGTCHWYARPNDADSINHGGWCKLKMGVVGVDQDRSPFATCNVHVTTDQFVDAHPEGFRHPLDKEWLLGNWSDNV